ncbi:hypothetical protein [Pseudomonas sp. NPDC087804]|uniref:hypothetical protein n=1 Tax=Pseudomonas sp. NPDC087804 TaxID=3364449 RepID=UPI0037F9BF18
MTYFKELSAAKKSSRKQLSALRKSLLTAGAAPQVEGMLGPIAGDDIHKLPVILQGKDCPVKLNDVQVPPGAKPDETFISLCKDGVPFGGWVDLPMVPDNPFLMTLGGAFTTTSGLFNLSYKIEYGGNDSQSESLIFFIDTTAPGFGLPATPGTPPVEVIDGLVTRDILADLDGITMTLDAPGDIKPGDIYNGYYGKSDPGVSVGSYKVVEDTTLPIEIKIEKNIIETMGEGQHIFYCKYEDRVGNIGPSSNPFTFTIQLRPTPSALKPPEVPLHEDDDLIDLDDAVPSLGVVIPVFDNGIPGDAVRVTFDGKIQPPKPTDGKTAVIVDVPFLDVKGTDPGPKDVTLTYEILREGKPYPEGTAVPLKVDLSIAGPVNPEPDPELGNPNLTKLIVKGSTGNDKLVEADVGNDIDIDLTIYTGYKDGDIVDLVWEGVKVPPPNGQYEVDGTEVAGFKIPFKLPKAVFLDSGNGIKSARYVISNPTANGDNENPSPPTAVDAYIIPIVLPAPKILNLYTNPANREFLNCSSLRSIPVVGWGAIVKVDGDTDFAPNMKLKFKWVGKSSDPDADPIEDFLFEKELKGLEHVLGFEVYLPFETALKTIGDGEGEISYVAEIDGHDRSGGSHKVRVVMINNEGGFCPLP